ncbi:hypothetical protein B0H11DRAFT_102228 [Mycena galericulata]|nr:hypothetical protein B0H11DRAFT_102228 [Mycena galericulata]
MQPRAVSQNTSISRPIPTLSPTAPAVVTPASVAPPLTTAQPVSTVIIISTLAPNPPPAPALTTSPPPIIPTATAVYTTVTQVFTTIPTPSPAFTISTPRGTDSETSSIFISILGTTNAGYGYSPPRSSSFSRASTVKPSASSLPSSSHSSRKTVSKSDIGKYVGYAIGAVFFLTLISSFFSAYRKHRKFVRKRPRGSIFIGAGLSDGQSSPRKQSMAQALMRSVSNRSFDAYALSNTPPRSPAPVYLSGSQHSHSDVLNRARGFSPSPSHVRPLPPTPSPKHTIHEEDAVFFPHVPPADPHEYSHSPFGVSSSGSSTQTTDPRWR